MARLSDYDVYAPGRRRSSDLRADRATIILMRKKVLLNSLFGGEKKIKPPVKRSTSEGIPSSRSLNSVFNSQADRVIESTLMSARRWVYLNGIQGKVN